VDDVHDLREFAPVAVGGCCQVWDVDRHRVHRCRNEVEQGGCQPGEVTSTDRDSAERR
jgi:hypothetical protein